MEKHFTTLETDFTLETLLPWRKGTIPQVDKMEEADFVGMEQLEFADFKQK